MTAARCAVALARCPLTALRAAALAGLANVSGDVREDKVRFAFEVFDLDNSGFIEAHELRKIVKATNLASEKQLDRKVRWLLSQCDRNGDGQIRCAAGAANGMSCSAWCSALQPQAAHPCAALKSSRGWPRNSPTSSFRYEPQ